MEMALSRLPLGIPAKVSAVRCCPVLIRRFESCGLIPGAEVLVSYRSPDCGVMTVEVGGAALVSSVRDLKFVRVKWERRP